MTFRPVHQNLDTSFVNLSALIKYLRRRQFAGSVHLHLNNYEAEIHITGENQMNVREHDRLSGRTGEGEEALQRILIRAREPGGTIGVFQKTNSAEPEKPAQPAAENKPPAAPPIKAPAQRIEPPKSFVSPVLAGKPPKIESANGKPKPASVKEIPASEKPPAALPEFPFRLSNNVEAKARQTKISPADWQTLLDLFGEILRTIDHTLARQNLNFPAAFARACAEIDDDYPFLKPDANIFQYQNGALKMTERISPPLLTASLLEAVRRILEKLGANPKFSKLYQAIIQNLRALIRQRKTLYDRFHITPKLAKITGA